MKTTVSAMEARRNFGHLLNLVALTHASITIERVGKPIAQLVGANRDRNIVEFRESLERQLGDLGGPD